MKNVIFAILFTSIAISSYAQKNRSLYIIINDSIPMRVSHTELQNERIVTYQLFSDRVCNKRTIRPFIKDKQLYKEVSISDKKDKRIIFIASFINERKNIQLVHENDIHNSLTYRELFEAKEESATMAIIRFFDNIYLINQNCNQEGWYIAKKVSIDVVKEL